MISLEIDNKEIEKTLLSQFKTPQEIKKYLYELVIEDMEDKRFSKLVQEEHKKDYVCKEDIFKVLDNI